MTGPVMAVAAYRTNAELIEAAHRLGHINADDFVLDCTYGKGTWWKTHRPHRLMATDLAPSSPYVLQADFRHLPHTSEIFDVACIDGPYKLNGTDQGEGKRYGVDTYASIKDRHQLIEAGIGECARVVKIGGRVLVKCQDQVCGGQLRWQTFEFHQHAHNRGLLLVERLDMTGHTRPQPARVRYRCLACGKDPAPGKHRCRKVDGWAVDNGHTDDLTAVAHVDAYPGGMTRVVTVAERDRPWLHEYPSPQQHAYGRPSTLLIFRKAWHRD